MADSLHTVLTRRERQIMDVLFRRGRATAAEVMDDLPGSPSYSTVRTQLRVLEEKGHVRHEEEGVRYVYMPAVRRHAARKSALKHLVETFFDGSAEKAVAALLGGEATRVTSEELDRISELIAKARIAELAQKARKDARDDHAAQRHDQGGRPGARRARRHCPAAPSLGCRAPLRAGDDVLLFAGCPGCGTSDAVMARSPAVLWSTSPARSSLRLVSTPPATRRSCPAAAGTSRDASATVQRPPRG